MRTSNINCGPHLGRGNRRIRPRRQAGRSASPEKDQDTQRMGSKYEEPEVTLAVKNRFAALSPEAPAPRTVTQLPSQHMQSDFTFRVKKRPVRPTRSKLPPESEGSSSTETERKVHTRRSLTLPPTKKSSAQGSPAWDQDTVAPAYKVALSAKKVTTHRSSLPEPSPLILEDTINEPPSSNPTASALRNPNDPSTHDTAFPSEPHTEILHPALPSPTPMTTDSPWKKRSPPAQRVQLPPTPPRTPSPDPAPPEENTQRKVVLVVVDLTAAKTPVQSQSTQTERKSAEETGQERPPVSRSVSSEIKGEASANGGSVTGDESYGDSVESSGDDDGEDWEWVG